MALTQTQIDQLNAAYYRSGGQTATDKANIDYAMKTYGWKPTAQATPTATAPTTPVAPATPATGLTDKQIQELNVAASRQSSGTASQTDLNNLAYAQKTYGYQVPKQVSASSLATPTPVKTVTPPEPTDLNSIVKGLTASNGLQSILNMKPESEQYKTAEAKQSGLMARLEEYLNKPYSQAERYNELTQQSGLPEQQKQLGDLNVQIAQLTAAFDQRMLDETGKPILNAIIGGKVDRLQRQKAVELGGLSAVAQALQGNISAAKNTISETIQMEFSDEMNRLEALQMQLEMNRDIMTAEEKKVADQQNVLLSERTRLLQEQMVEKEGVMNIMLAAAQNGADTATLQKIMSSSNTQDAIIRSGSYLSQLKVQSSGGSPVKIGQNSQGQDIFYVDGYGVVTGDELLGISGGGPDDVVIEQYDPEAYGWATAIQNGQAKISDITGNPELKTKVVTTLNSLPPSQKAIAEAEKMVGTLEGLLNHSGLNSAVGPNALSRFPIVDIFGNKDAFLMQASQVISKEALNNLINAKKDGATFGALSDRELNILQSAATSIGSRALYDKNGVLKGFDTTENAFKSEVTNLINGYKQLIREAKDPLQVSFNQGGSGTPTATLSKVTSYNDGQKAGQCGRFVNKITGLGLGDSYQSKMSKMNPAIKYPAPGMVFVMPYKDTGHTGFILGVKGDKAIVRDSNWGLDEKVKTHEIPISKITGLTYA